MLTEDADKEAFCRVAALAEELLPPGTSGKQLIDDWRPLFHASPWCPEGKVGPSMAAECAVGRSATAA